MGIANIINNSTTTSGGEIIRELVNASDGAGLHLEAGGTITLTNAAAAEFGTSDFSLEFVLNRTANNTNNNVIYESHSSGNNRITLKALTGGDLVATFTNSSGVNADYNTGYDIDVDLNTVKHYALTFDRSGDLTVYKNGNSVATISIAASSAVNIGDSNTNTGRIGYVTTYGVIGTFLRFRTWNKLVDAKALFERADVDFSSQYGSQTKLIDSDFNGSFDGWNTSNDWATQTNNSNAMQLVANAANQICRTGTQLTKGKRYRVTYTASAVTGTPGFSTAAATHVVAGVISAGTANSFEFTFPTSATSQYFYIKSNASGDAVTLDDISVVQIGCVSDYQTQWANPSQSLTVQDASGNADGTCSASGVSQVNSVVQLNSTSARIGTFAATPADGQILVDGGAKTAPGYSFGHTTATGMYSPGANQIRFSTASTDRLTIASDGQALFSGSKVTVNTDGTVDWGNAADAGRLTWDTNDAKIRGVAGKNLKLGANNTDYVTIDTNGNVMLGTPAAGSAASVLHISSAAPRIRLEDTSAPANYSQIGADNGQLTLAADGGQGQASSAIIAQVDGSERMRIDGAGDITSASATASKPILTLENTTNDANSSQIVFYKNRTATAADNLGTIRFKGNTSSGAIEEYATIYAQSTGITTGGEDSQMFFRTRHGGSFAPRLTIQSDGAINIANLSASSDVQTDGSKNLITSSDKRLKNDIGELTAGLDIVANLQPHYFSWKSDETNTQQLGFYAQDVYDFLPEAAPREQKQNLITPAVEAEPATYYEEGDELPDGKAVGDEKTPAVEAVEAVFELATNEDGTPDYAWGFNGRPIIAALVAAVKELKAKVETLENA